MSGSTPGHSSSPAPPSTSGLSSGMDLTIVGCAGSFPGPGSAASCYLLTAVLEERRYALVLDLGSGALGPLQQHIDPLTLDAVLLSHLHPDHCLDLTGLHVMRTHHPLRPPPARLDVFAPEGAGERVGRAHGVQAPKDVQDTFDFHALRDRQVLRVGPFTITAVAVSHPVPAFGFRVHCGGATLAYTGDTDECPALSALMTGADLVLADSAFVEGRDTTPGVHLSGRRAARAAIAAGGVGRLMLTHLPAWNDPEVCRAEASALWAGTVEIAEPGVVVHLGDGLPNNPGVGA
ncbi:MAG: MBL fold metallo-hydrolase [Ornithinimicrobium sp.]